MTTATRAQKSEKSGLIAIVVTSCAAILTGLAALFFVLVEDWGGQLRIWLQDIDSVFGIGLGGYWPIVLPAVLVLVSMCTIVVVQRRWFPGTEGTGIPQAIAALRMGEHPERHMMLSIRIAAGKMLLLTLALLGGITVGREGPSVHVGACFMYLSSRVCKMPTWLVERGLILAGSAAGIAAAFNTPIAGVVFCFEEVGRTFDKNSVPCILRTVALACGVCVVFLGNYFFYTDVNSGAHLPLGLSESGGYAEFFSSLRQWTAVPIIGIAGGILGGLFGRAVVEASSRVAPWLRLTPLRSAIALGLALAIIGILSAGESYGGGYGQAKAMLVAAHEGTAMAPWYAPFGKAAASFVSLISAIPGGLFDPTLAVGAGLGQLTYPLFNNDFVAPGIGLPEVMMLFMAAYFAGVVQSPITVFVILFEMTGAYGMILPLMFAAMIGAMIAARLCEPSIYEALAQQFLAARGLSATEK